MLIFSGKANTSIHGLGEDDTARTCRRAVCLFEDIPGSLTIIPLGRAQIAQVGSQNYHIT